MNKIFNEVVSKMLLDGYTREEILDLIIQIFFKKLGVVTIEERDRVNDLKACIANELTRIELEHKGEYVF